MQGLKISKMQVIDNPKEDAKIPIVQNGTNYSMPFGTLNKLLIQIYENSDILKQVSDAATEVACRLAALTDAENNISAAEEQREVSVRNALEYIAEASGKAEDTAAHPGYVDNDGYYHKWNVTTRTYEKTDANLKGEKGDTFTFDDLTDEQKASLKGDKGEALTFDDLTEEQKASLKGDKGDTFTFDDLTDEQKASLKGDKGEALTFDALTEEQKASLKGDKGEALTFDDLTDEQKEQLKGEKGDTGYLRIVNHGTDDTTCTVPVNEMHVWGEVTELNISFGANPDQTKVATYAFKFTSGTAATTLTLPGDVTLPAGFIILPKHQYVMTMVFGMLEYWGAAL